jgi:hypothetical protein
MEHWEFLIQREGDRGWRPIKTSGLQLMEGRYRIVANCDLKETQIQTQITHQVMDETAPERRFQPRSHVSNSRGLVVVMPFADLRSGVWQFICSGTDIRTTWQQVLHLKVLPHSETIAPVTPTTSKSVATIPSISRLDLPTSPEPFYDSEEGTLEHLLEQIERDLARSLQPSVADITPQVIEFTPLNHPPSRLINLEQSTFADMTPGDRLTIEGACNLQLVDEQLIQDNIISKLSVSLRHSQTAKIVANIEAKVPPYLARFAFHCELKLPTGLTTNLLVGEVSLHDLVHTQVGACGFTVTLNVDPLPEFDLSFLDLLEADLDGSKDLLTIEHRSKEKDSPPADLASIESPPSSTTSYPNVPIAYRRESLFAKYPEIQPVPPPTPFEQRIQPPYPNPAQPGQMELELEDRYTRNCDTLEVVIDE